MPLNSKQKHIYKANMYVFGHRDLVKGKIVVTKNHDYPLCSDCSKFQAWKMTASICTHNGIRTVCQGNRTSSHETRNSNGCGNEGKFFSQSKKQNYKDSYNAYQSKNLSPLTVFLLFVLFILSLIFY